jgi:hypothetical protein
MKVGLHISDFTWDGGAAQLRFKLGEIAERADQGGVDRISVMDHVWQIGHIGPPEHEMLEAYTALGWLAARSSASARPGTRLSRVASGCSSRRPPSASSGWRKRSRSSARCGAIPRHPTRASTITWSAR